MRHKSISWSWEVAAVFLITLLAAALRFYRLPEVPPGLHFDEGFKGVTASGLLDGAPPRLFFESDMGEEPIAIYLVAAALGLFGRQPWVVRLPSAIIGTLTIPLAWWLGRELAASLRPRQDTDAAKSLAGPITGLGTALVLAILYWHLSFSRIGMEPILVPFFACLSFAALARGLRAGSRPALVVGGLTLGASLYTYKAGYFVPIVAMLFVVCAAVFNRQWLRRYRRGLLLVTLAFLLIAAPIGLYFVIHPASFLQRPASVTVAVPGADIASTWRSLAQNLPKVLGMFFLRGDENPRSNLPGRPALDPFLSLLFLVGLGRALMEFRRPGLALPALWLGVMVVPTWITDYAPHFGRAIGATPAVALLCAMGGWTLWQGAERLGRGWPRGAVGVLLAGGLMFSGASTARAYFHTWAASPDLFYAFDVGLAQVAGYMNERPGDENVYLTPTSHEHFTLQFLVHRPWSSFDGRSGLVLPPPGQVATVIALVAEDQMTLDTLQQLRPDGQIAWTLDDCYGRPYAVAYSLPADSRPPPEPDYGAEVTFGAGEDGRARLLGYSLEDSAVKPGDTVYLSFYWQALAPFDRDYTVFAHLLGGHNPASNGPLWAGHDGQPDGGHYPTSDWNPGEIVVDVHPLVVPDDAPAGTYQIEVGFYLLSNLTRLPAVDGAASPLPGDAAVPGTIEVREGSSQ